MSAVMGIQRALYGDEAREKVAALKMRRTDIDRMSFLDSHIKSEGYILLSVGGHESWIGYFDGQSGDTDCLHGKDPGWYALRFTKEGRKPSEIHGPSCTFREAVDDLLEAVGL